jgi:HEAT repeat protein
MKKLLLLLILPSMAFAFDTFESERYLYAYMRFTKEVKRMSSNIPLNEHDPKILQELKFELKSCGISSTVDSCLDSKFKSVKALESFNNENLEGTRFLVKAFTKDLMNQSLIIQVMTIHAEFEQVQVDRVEFFKESIPLDGGGFRTFFEKYLKNEAIKLFETSEFFPHEITKYLQLGQESQNPLEIFHSINLVKALDLEKTHTEEIHNILKDKFEIILKTQSPLYQIEFLNLFETQEDLRKELAQRFFKSSDPAAKGKAAIVLANLGVNDLKVKEAISSIIKTSVNYHDQLDALNGLFKIKDTLDDDILILSTIKSGNPDVSKKAYELSLQLKFTQDHIKYLAAELANPSPEYRVYMLDFLSKIDSPESTKIILEKLDDMAEPVTQKAFKILKDRKLDSADFHKVKKYLKTLKDFTKFYCLQLLDLDKSEEISFIMIDHLTDLFPKVEELSVQLLMGREITPKMEKELKKLVNKKKAKVYALKILSKLETPEITSLLLGQLTEVEENDINGLYEIIKKRNLDASKYEPIKALFRSKESRVRTAAVKLLAKFPDNATLDFLKNALPSEPERAVKQTMETLIKYMEDKLFPKPPVEPTAEPSVPPTVVEPTVVQPAPQT